MLLSESFQVNGCRAVGDMQGITFAYMRHMEIRIVKMWARALDKCLPVRTKSMIIFNQPTFVVMIFKIFQMVMSKKMRERLMMFGKNEGSVRNSFLTFSKGLRAQLSKFIPLLSKNIPKLSSEFFFENLQLYFDWLKNKLKGKHFLRQSAKTPCRKISEE